MCPDSLLGVGYGIGDINFDGVLEITDTEVDVVSRWGVVFGLTIFSCEISRRFEAVDESSNMLDFVSTSARGS